MRLFVAIDTTASVRAELASLIEQLKQVERRARWVRPEGMHITLKFLGETPADRVAGLREVFAKINVPRPVEIRFRGLGFFPNDHRPRVLWVGVDASPNLAELAGKVDQEVARIGFPREERPYAPHLTLARLSAASRWEALVRAAGELSSREFGSSRDSEFHLIESFLKPSGAEYKKVASFSFVRETA